MTEVVIILLVLFGVVWTIAYRLREAAENENLRRTNPELWMRQQELEAAEKQRQHERRQTGLKAGGAIGMMLWKIFMKK